MLSAGKKAQIKDIIYDTIRAKIEKYNPESKSMPFHNKLIGKDKMAAASFIHSLHTTFGTSIFEPVAIALAEDKFPIVREKVKIGTHITEEAYEEIGRIISNLSTGNATPNKNQETKILRNFSRSGNIRALKPALVDIYLEEKEGRIVLMDIKTVKPNKSAFQEYKRTLLEWVAMAMLEHPRAEISSYIAIPYNPYEPKPYGRWTMLNMLDRSKELMVAEEMWNFLAQEEVYKDLLACFARAGKELRGELDEFMKRLAATHKS